MMKLTSALTLVLMLSSALVGVASACSCAEPGPPLEELDRFPAVFLGYVQSTEVIPGTYEGIAQVRVVGAWKGVTQPIVRIYSDSMCGYYFTASEEYVIYAHSVVEPLYGEHYAATICSRTRISRDASADFEALGNPRPVGTETSSWGRIKALY